MNRFNFITLLSCIFLLNQLSATAYGMQDATLAERKYYHPSSQLSLVTKCATDFECVDVKTADLSAVRAINLRDSKGVSCIIAALVENNTLRNLIHIDLANTDVSLADLKRLRDNIKSKPAFIRPMERVSSRFGNQVACIEVDISGTNLANDDESRWELNNDIQIPVEQTVPIFYLATQEFGEAHLQILLIK